MDKILTELLDTMPKKPAVRFCAQCGGQLVQAEIDGRKRPTCRSTVCNYVFWDSPTPVVGAIVEHEGAVILARSQGWPEGMFGVITGFLERGETPEAGILREVQEELGVEGTLIHFIGNYSFFEMNQVIFMFHVRTQGELCIADELAEIKRVNPNELRPWSLGAGPAVRDWLTERSERN